MLEAELESLASGPLDEVGAVSVLRTHALSGYSLALAQFTGGRVTLADGTRALLEAIASAAPVETRLETPVAAVRARGDGVEVETRGGERLRGGGRGRRGPAQRTRHDRVRARAVGGQAGGDRARAGLARREDLPPRPRRRRCARTRFGPAIRSATSTPSCCSTTARSSRSASAPTQPAATRADAAGVQRALDEILPGYELVAATAHDWVADEYARGTWATHRPGWFTRHHAEMRRPEGRDPPRRLRPRERLGRLHRRRDRVGPRDRRPRRRARLARAGLERGGAELLLDLLGDRRGRSRPARRQHAKRLGREVAPAPPCPATTPAACRR